MIPAQQVLLPVWSREAKTRREAESGGNPARSRTEFSPPPTWPNSPVCGLGSGIRDHLHLSLLQHPMPRLWAQGCEFWLLLPGSAKSGSAEAECI